MLDAVLEKINTLKDEGIALQEKLTSLQAIGPSNGGAGEKERADYIVRYLNDHGLSSVQSLNALDESVPSGIRPNLVLPLEGAEDRQGTFWILSHLDTVPAGDPALWKSDPFQAVVRGGRIFGRGTEDNQQSLVASLLAVRALCETGTKPVGPAGLVMVSDEETGNRYGVEHLMSAGIFKREDFVLVPDAGSPDGTMIELAEKTILWLKIEITGRQCHASVPAMGINTLKIAANLIVRLQALSDRFSTVDPLFEPPSSTFEPTRKEENVPNINTIPGRDVFYMDCRILPSYQPDDVIGAVMDICNQVERETGAVIATEVVEREDAHPPTPADTPLVGKLQQALLSLREIQGKPCGIGGGTAANYFRKEGIPAVVWSTADRMGHQPDEYCVIENMISDAQVFAWLLLHL
ncbi:M20 family metallo-hydrolase [Acidobacteriota bacterium]